MAGLPARLLAALPKELAYGRCDSPDTLMTTVSYSLQGILGIL